jgi:predicted nucleic acid-binding Zn ribbon protein
MPRHCPFCREPIREESTFCRYCNRDLEDFDLLKARLRVRRAALAMFILFGAGLLIVILGSLR